MVVRSTAVMLGVAMVLGTSAARAADTGLEEITVTATRHEESLSKVPISVTALTQEGLEQRGVKDFNDVARFTPGVNVDNSGTNNISIRGIASTGGAGTTGIYLDDTPIQMRALALNPDEALPKSFDIERVEVLRGPQGTLFGSGSEGGTVRYITAQPSLTKTSGYARVETSYTQGGSPSYEAGVAYGAPVVDGTLGVRATVWYRRDGGWIDRIDPTTLALAQKNANYDETTLVRLAGVWAVNERWTVTPAFYWQNRYRNDVGNYWGIYSDPAHDRYVNANPTQRTVPDTFYLPSIKVEGDLGSVRLISNTSYYRRHDTTGYDGTLYNLGFFQNQPQNSNPAALPVIPQGDYLPGTFPLLDGSGVHLPASVRGYRVLASVDNGQQNFTQEIRLQSAEGSDRLTWTTGVYFGSNKQTYLEQLHDPQLNSLFLALTGQPFTYYTVDPTGNPVNYDPRFPVDSYFLQTSSKDQQLALFGEATYGITDRLKLTAGARAARMKYSFDTLTGGPTLFLQPQLGSGDKSENAFTPKVSLGFQADPNNLYYATYAKGFRPGGANNPVPQAACGADFLNFGISGAPKTFNADSVDSFEIGSKNNLAHRVRLAASVYYIKWNNIQQTVLPPICQISFITNLGQAVAKGGDVQLDLALTDGLTADIAAGYTSARYTQDSRLSPAELSPIVAKGDAVTGQSNQPGAPFTATVGLEYRFALAAHEAFVRVDDEYQGRAKWLSPGQDPASQQYDAANFVLSSTNFASARAGVAFGRWQWAAFVDNLTDTHVVTNFNFTIDSNVGLSRLERQFAFRPRTFGLSMTYR